MHQARILILGGTREGDRLSILLRARRDTDPVLVIPPGGESQTSPDCPAIRLLIETREQLLGLMTGMSAVVIAAHPYSGVFASAAAAVAAELGVPCLRLMREPWRPGPQDRWITADSPRAAAAELVRGGHDRVFLSLARDQLDPFLALAGRQFFVRLPGAADLPGVTRARILTDPGPYSPASERALLQSLGIRAMVARNIGGQGGWPKLQAARMLQLPVFFVRRPPVPEIDLRTEPELALDWLEQRLGLDLAAALA